MLRYVCMRLVYTIVVILGVSLLVFVITHVVGNPVNVMLPLQASDEERAQLRHQLGLDKPLGVQLVEFMSGMVRLDFGKSWWQQEPALQLALRRMPATFQLVAAAFALAVLIAIPLGILAAYKPGSVLDRLLTVTSLVGVCVPSFWVALLLVIGFSVKLGWFPTSGYGSLRHMVLPVVTLAILPGGHMAQIMRFSMLDQLNQQYVTTARAKGLTEGAVVFKHALKNAATAVLTMGGMDLGRMLAGETAAVEMVYGWPGFGSLVLETIARQDFPLLQASVFVVAIIICLINLIVDLSYGLFDPRIRYQ
ncbi:MAG: ABC transporter permease [Bacillota bacterium]